MTQTITNADLISLLKRFPPEQPVMVVAGDLIYTIAVQSVAEQKLFFTEKSDFVEADLYNPKEDGLVEGQATPILINVDI